MSVGRCLFAPSGQAEQSDLSLADDPDILEFIAMYVPSVWAVELLVLLKTDPSRHWRSIELVKELRASTKIVGELLSAFEKQGLVAQASEGWRFSPANPTLDALVTRLLESYSERPMHTISLIAHQSTALHSLANAFRLKKDGP